MKCSVDVALIRRANAWRRSPDDLRLALVLTLVCAATFGGCGQDRQDTASVPAPSTSVPASPESVESSPAQPVSAVAAVPSTTQAQTPAPAPAPAPATAPEDARKSPPQRTAPFPPVTARSPEKQSRERGLPAPPVRFDPPVLDFGVALPGRESSATFSIPNIGREPLRVATMKPDCRCTTMTDLTGSTIPPGESIEVTATLDARSIVGLRRASVQFVFEGYRPATILLKGEVTRAIKPTPGYISGFDADHGKIKIESVDGRPFRVLSVNGGPPSLVGFDPSTDEITNKYVLEWDLSDLDPDTCLDRSGKLLRPWYVIETDHPDAPLVDVLVRHRCITPERSRSRPWVLQRQEEVLGALEPGAAASFTIGIKPSGAATTDQELAIDAVTVDEGPVTAVLGGLEGEGEQAEYRIEVTPDVDHRGFFYSILRLHGGDQSAPLVVIGTVREPRAVEPAPGR